MHFVICIGYGFFFIYCFNFAFNFAHSRLTRARVSSRSSSSTAMRACALASAVVSALIDGDFFAHSRFAATSPSNLGSVSVIIDLAATGNGSCVVGCQFRLRKERL